MNLLVAPILLPLATALLALLARGRPNAARVIGVTGAAVQLFAAIVLLMTVERQGIIVMQPGSWPAPFGIALVADMLSALMVLITAITALAVAIYSLGDIEERLVRAHYWPLFHFLLTGVNGAFLTGDLFNLYVWFEVMLIASFVLIVLGGGRNQLEGGLKYLVINLFSSMLFLAGVGLIYGKLGTLNMADIARKLADSPDVLLVTSSASLLLVAFGIKAALFPFFFWLPASYHTPRFAVSAIFAGLLTKVGVYALIRAYTLIFHAHFDVVQGILLFLAGATMLTGVLGAAAQFEVRRILSFHIISQIGYMIMGLAIGTAFALAGAVFYILHHILVKTNLFLLGGLIARRCGSADLAKTGGLYAAAPFLAMCFFIPAFSLGGIPPLSGFWAKFAVIKAGLEGHHYILVAVALLVGILTLYSMTKIWAEAFWKAQPPEATDARHLDPSIVETTAPGDLPWTAPAVQDADRDHPVTDETEARQAMLDALAEMGPSERRTRDTALIVPCVAMALLTLGIGLWSQPLFDLAGRAGVQLKAPAIYVEAVLGPEAVPAAWRLPQDAPSLALTETESASLALAEADTPRVLLAETTGKVIDNELTAKEVPGESP